MLQKPGDEVEGGLGELVLGLGVKEGVLPVLEEGEVGVHAAAVDAPDGLGQEGGVEVVVEGDALHHPLEGGDVVSGGEGVGVLEVNLVLARGHLVVAGLNLKAHGHQGVDHVPPGLLALIYGSQVKVARLVVGLHGGEALGGPEEEEELGLGAGVHVVKPELLQPLNLALQHIPGVPLKGAAVGVGDVADEPGHPAPGGVLHAVRQDDEGVVVGLEEHVRLLNAGEALNGGAVKHDLPVQGLLKLGLGYLHVLDHAQDVRDLKPQKLDLFPLQGF